VFFAGFFMSLLSIVMSHPKAESTMRSQSKDVSSADVLASMRSKIRTVAARHLPGDDATTERRNDWTTVSKRSGWSY